jgi:hypothetical protein
MRTKTLLIAVAALAAGVLTSSAQTYSQNVVGYVNVVYKGANAYTLVANPLDDGNGNIMTNIVGNLPAGSTVTTWAGTGFNAPIQKTAGGWPATAGISLPPGVAFFVKNGKASPASPDFTNTFVGSVVVPVHASVTNVLALGYNLAGSQIPYAGDLIADTNLNLQVPRQSSLTSWNVAAQGYDAPIGKTAGGWPSGATFVVTPGQGYFIKEGLFQTNWVQTLNP